MYSDEDSITLRRFGKHLKALRKVRNSQFREFSLLTDIHTDNLLKYENGEAGPTLITLRKLATGLGMHPSELLRFEFTIASNNPN